MKASAFSGQGIQGDDSPGGKSEGDDPHRDLADRVDRPRHGAGGQEAGSAYNCR